MIIHKANKNRISRAYLIRSFLTISLLNAGLTQTTLAETESPIPQVPIAIEAVTYPVKILQKSKSNKIYLMGYENENENTRTPQTGKILLLRKDKLINTMAFRLLQTYPKEKILAAKSVRTYPDVKTPEIGDEFLCLEKISDILAEPPTKDEQREMGELEALQGLRILPYDPELDKNSSEANSIEEEDPEPEVDQNITIKEVKPIDLHKHWLTLGFGLLSNDEHYFTAGNLRYGINLMKRVFFKKNNLEDSLTLEAGLYFYKTLNFNLAGDAYTLSSFVGSARYNLWFSESFGIFTYFGAMRAVIISAVLPDPGTMANLTNLVLIGGAGLFFQVGPNWYTRLDAGIESFTINLLLRF